MGDKSAVDHLGDGLRGGRGGEGGRNGLKGGNDTVGGSY